MSIRYSYTWNCTYGIFGVQSKYTSILTHDNISGLFLGSQYG
jgi:hypothetical protein